MKYYKDIKQMKTTVTKQFQMNTRPLPSENILTNGDLLSEENRKMLLDFCAICVDKNPTGTGRSDMCIYFSCLLRYALRLLGYKAEVHLGKATYNIPNDIFTWNHSWVTVNDTLIDGNADSMIENPCVPYGFNPYAFWGNIDQLPKDRIFNSEKMLLVSDELDELDDDYIEWKRQIKSYLKSTNMI